MNLLRQFKMDKMARSCLLFCGMLLSLSLSAADYYWVGIDAFGNGDWNDPYSWAGASAGANGTGGTGSGVWTGTLGGVPGFADDVYFDANSFPTGLGTATINCHAVCHDIDFNTGSTGTELGGSSIYTLTITGSVDFESGMNYTFGGDVHFEAILSSETIEWSAFIYGDVYFDGPGADWELQTTMTMSNSVVYLVNGTLDFNANAMRMNRFVSNNSNVRELDISGLALMHITGSYPGNAKYGWDTRNSTNFTLTSTNDSRIIFEAGPTTHAYMASDGVTFDGQVEFNQNLGNATIDGTNTFTSRLILGTSTYILDDNTVADLYMSEGMVYTVGAGSTVEITNYWEAIGVCDSMIMLKSDHCGQDATIDFVGAISSSTVYMNYLIIEHMASPTGDWDGVNSGYIVNLANMTSQVDWPATTLTGNTLTWTGSVNNLWSEGGNWTGGGGCAPSPLDDVLFDTGSGSGIVNLDVKNATCKDMTWSGVSGITFDGNSANNLTIYGSIALESTASMDWDYEGSTRFKAHSGVHTVNIDDQTMDGHVYFEGGGGEWNLTHDFSSIEEVFVTAGTFRTNNGGPSYGMDIRGFYSNIYNDRTVDIESSTITCNWAWDVYSYEEVGGGPDTSLSFNSTGSTIELTNGNFQGSNDYGNTYNNLNMNRVNGTQRLWASNIFNGNVTFAGNAIIQADNTVDGNITLAAGKAYTLGGTQTLNQTSSDLVAIGSCSGGYIYIKNGGFHKASGADIDVEYCIIKNNVASTVGSAVDFDGDNSILLGSSNGIWSVINPYSGPLYFQASIGDKDWNTGTNWYINSSFSGYPAGGACPPNPLNDVYFIDYSFDLYSGVKGVEVDVSNAFCKGMYWGDPLGTPDPPYDFGIIDEHNSNDVLHVFGDMYLQGTSIMDWDMNGEVWFEGDDSTTYEITSATHMFLQEVTFDGDAGAVWELQDDFTVNTGTEGIEITTGTVDASNVDIEAGHIWSDGSATRGINIINSDVTLRVQTQGSTSRAWHSNNTNFSFSSSGSEISIDNIVTGGEAWLDADGVTFHNVTFENDCKGHIRGDNNKSFNDVSFNGNGYFSCDNEFTGNLYFRPGYQYILNAGTRQTLTATADFLASGTLGNTVFIKSDATGDEAEIEKDGGVICLNYTSIRDNDAVLTNGAMLFDGPNGFNVANNTNWAFTSCTPETIYGCAGEGVTFNSLFNGSSFAWNFGDGSGTDTVAQPTYTYASPGTYTVSVTVTSNTTTDVQYFYAVISPSCCQAAQDSTYEDISGTIATSTIWPDKVFVSADVYVTSQAVLEIANSDVVLADSVGIYLQDTASLIAVNSTFRPCDPNDYWVGIDFSEEAKGEVNECVIDAAAIGMNIITDTEVEASNNQFVNCQKGIYMGVESSSSMEHVATGNTFVLNADNPFTTSGTNDFFGIQIVGLRLHGLVSQNDFLYSSSAAVNDRFYGIYNSSGQVYASDNSFTNVTFCYTQIGGTGTNAFENNDIDFNKAVIGLYTTPSQIVAVTLDGVSATTLIGNNRMTLSYESGENSTAVYMSGCGSIVARANQINGFEYGFQILESEEVEVSFNEIDDVLIGIYTDQSNVLTIEDNVLKMVVTTGISVNNGTSSVIVDRNTVKGDPVGGPTGIEYIIDGNTAPSAIQFADNCVFDTETAMHFENQHGSNCQNLPTIEGNYLFNYTGDGMYIDHFNGNIGAGGTTGQNSFVRNAGLGNDVNVTFTSCPSPSVTLQNNWPNGLAVNGDVMDMGGVLNSYATCGNQAVKEGLDLPILETFIVEHYPVDYNETTHQYELRSNYAEAFDGLSANERVAMATATHGALASNDDLSSAKTLVAGLETGGIVAGNDLHWLRYRMHTAEGNWEQAVMELSKVTPNSLEVSDQLQVERIRMKLIQDEKGLSNSDAATLKAIDDRRDLYAAEARDVIHMARNQHPYIYSKVEVKRTKESVGSENQVATPGAMLMYPNPSSDVVKVSFTVEELNQAQLTIHNVFGELVQERSLTGNMNSVQLDVSDLPGGIYMISIYNNDALLDAQQLIKN